MCLVGPLWQGATGNETAALPWREGGTFTAPECLKAAVTVIGE